jgi:hypothetical protein
MGPGHDRAALTAPGSKRVRERLVALPETGRFPRMAAEPDLSAEERETLELVQALIASGNLHPLVERLRAGETGPERARDALVVLSDLDRDLLVQLALDTLIDQYVGDPGLAHQTRREIRGDAGQPPA